MLPWTIFWLFYVSILQSQGGELNSRQVISLYWPHSGTQWRHDNYRLNRTWKRFHGWCEWEQATGKLPCFHLFCHYLTVGREFSFWVSVSPPIKWWSWIRRWTSCSGILRLWITVLGRARWDDKTQIALQKAFLKFSVRENALSSDCLS